MKLLKNILNLFCKDIKKSLKKSLNDSDLIFASVDALYYILNKIRLSRDESYTDSSQ